MKIAIHQSKKQSDIAIVIFQKRWCQRHYKCNDAQWRCWTSLQM